MKKEQSFKTYVCPEFSLLEVKCESFLSTTSPANGGHETAGNDGDDMD